MDLEDFVDGLVEVGEDEVVVAVAVPGGAEEDGGGAGDMGGLGIGPFIADDEGSFEVEVPFEAGFDEESGLGFAAWAAVGFVVGADEDIVEGQSLAEHRVHEVEFSPGLVAAGDPGLIGGADQDEARRLESAQGGEGVRVDVEFIQGQGCDLVVSLGAHEVQDSVSLEEHS